MGGIGKTQCALQYVYSNRTNYERIYWISAVDQASLLSGYQKIAKNVGLLKPPETSPLEIAEAVLSWLKQERNWLLVIDNLDDISIVKDLLPETGSERHTLITTRNPNTKGIPAEPLEVPPLDDEDSLKLLSILSEIDITSNSAEKEQAEKIVEELGYLPLAIEQAAAFVREVTGDFALYLEEYHKNRMRVHQWIPEGNRQYSYSIATTWSMSFRVLRSSHLHAANLLRLLAFLNPDGILIDFLIAGVEALQSDLRQVISDRIEMAKALLALEKSSLIKWNRRNKLITIHRLVQMVISDEMPDEDSTSILNNIIDLCTKAFPEFTTNETRSLCRTYQGQIVEPLLRMKTIRTSKFAHISKRVGEFLRDEGKYDDSRNLLFQAVEIYTSLFGSKHSDTLTAMNSLAWTYQAQGRYADAATIEEEVLETRKRILGEDHPDTIATMNGLAWTCHLQGKYANAVRIQEEVLEKRRRILGEEHPQMLTAMNNLAVMYNAQGRYADAAKIEEEVLEKYRRIMGEENTDMLIAMNNLSVTYNAQGRYTDAAKIEEEVLEKRNKILGGEHPQTLRVMNDLAWTYQAKGKYTEAAKIQEEVLEKRNRILGEEHPATLAVMNSLAWTYQVQGRYADAVKIQEKVLEKRNRILGEEHPDTLTAMDGLASTYQALGRYADATRIQEEVFEKRRRILGGEHPQTLIAMNNLALTYHEQGRDVDAIRIQEEVLEKRKRILGEDHPDTLMAMNNLALMYNTQGRGADAVKIEEEVFEKRKRILGEKHPDTLAATHILVQAYEQQGRMAQAVQLREQV
jgi:tetratricopeptide (TPR) repeat protein